MDELDVRIIDATYKGEKRYAVVAIPSAPIEMFRCEALLENLRTLARSLHPDAMAFLFPVGARVTCESIWCDELQAVTHEA